MRMLFGTDGIRGVAGDPPLDHNTVFAVGVALGRYLRQHREDLEVVIGQDTRESSCVDLRLHHCRTVLGRRPREACRRDYHSGSGVPRAAGILAGIVISASHNPWTDNGIKIFGHDGYKLSDELEEQIETDIFDLLHGRVPELKSIPAAKASPESAMATDPVLLRQYVEWLAATVKGTSFRA